MENNNNGEFNRLVSELTQGRDLVQQLQHHLISPYSSSSSSSGSGTSRETLLLNIQSKFDNALSLLNSSSPFSNSMTVPNFGMTDSPRSFTTSPPLSEDSDRDHEPKESANRKRKSSAPRWTKQVQVHPGAAIEGTLDDGFSWRKYGQKDILGARHPRGYYRCTLRHVQGCLATKQVQRSDEDPTIFEIKYRGRHTCNQNGGNNNTNNMNPSVVSPIIQSHESNLGNNGPRNHELQQHIPIPQYNPQEVLLNLQKNLNISKLDDLNFNNNNMTFPSSFNIPSLPENYNIAPNSITPDNNFLDNSPYSFMPGENSGSTGFIPSQMNSFHNGGSSEGYQFNSSMGFDSNYPFDYHGFSS